MANIEKLMAKGISYLKRNGVKKTCDRMVRKLILTREVNYEEWLKLHTPDEETLDLQRKNNTGDKPVVLVQIIDDKGIVSGKTLESVTDQTYGFLAVGKNMEHADYCLVLRNGVILSEHAVYEMVKAAQEDPEAELFYTDDDVLIDEKYKDPFFKPGFDICLFEQWDYLGDVLFMKKELVQKITDITDVEEIAGKAEKISRIPQILSHTDGSYRKKRKLVDRGLCEEPKITVIIPNRDHGWDLRNCVESLVEQGGYHNLEILIVENNSEKEETFTLYQILKDSYPCIKVLKWDDHFNYAAINNFAAQQAQGEYLLFLNNDTKVKQEGFLAELMKWGSMDKCGAIGARLLYADETIQHGGVVLGYGGIAGHAFEGMTCKAYEETAYAHLVRRMTAVTGACMLVKRAAFQEAGGFNEELKVAYNDIDLCMKLQQCGYMVLYDPYAQMYHLESQTRGFEMTKEKAMRVQEEAALFCDRWKEELEEGDRYYNPNLTLEKPDFSINRE